MNLTPATIARKIKLPLKQWPGNCHAVASLMLEHGIVTGELRYGHYHGPIHPSSLFRGRKFTHHGWIEKDGQVIDPTRWVFECKPPYIHIGPITEEYDFGGNRVRKMTMRPCPAFNPKGKLYNCQKVSEPIRAFLDKLIPGQDGILGAEQVMWIANLPLDMMVGYEKEIYEWIADDIGFPGFIPFDNRMKVLGR